MKAFAAMVMLTLLCGGAAHAAGKPPRGWTLEGDGAAAYDVGTEAVKGVRGSQAAFLRARAPRASIANLVQRFNAHGYAGRRVVLAGALKTRNAKGATLFVTVVGATRPLLNRATAPLNGTGDWKSLALVVDVPRNAILIKIGFGLAGEGTVWADNLSFALAENP